MNISAKNLKNHKSTCRKMAVTRARKPTVKDITFNKPHDYETLLNVNKNAEEKEMDRYCIKFWWIKSSNGKDTYVLKGQQLFKTMWKNGRKPVSVLTAMISKYNEQIVNVQKMEIYDNSIYGKVTKVAIYNGIETVIHDDYRKIIYAPNNKNIGFLTKNT